MNGPGCLALFLCAFLIPWGNRAGAGEAAGEFSWCRDATKIRQMLCQSAEFRTFSAAGPATTAEPSQIVTPADAPKGYREQIMILE